MLLKHKHREKSKTFSAFWKMYIEKVLIHRGKAYMWKLIMSYKK